MSAESNGHAASGITPRMIHVNGHGDFRRP